MKKLFTILAFLFIAFSLTAQDKIITGSGVSGKIFFPDTGVNHGFATHKLLHNAGKAAAYNYTFQLNVSNPYYFVYSVHLRDHEAGTANTATVILKGSIDNVQFINLDTIAYSSVADSLKCIAGSNDLLYEAETFQYPLNPLAYKYLRLTVTPTDSIWVKSIWLNVLPIK